MIRNVSVRQMQRPESRTVAGAGAMLGAALVASGVAVPWLTFFAGLQQLNALGTLNGTLLLLGAATAAGLAAVVALRGGRRTRTALTAAGIGLTAFAAYLVVQTVATYREASADPLLLAAPGPGVGLVAAGALVILLASLIGD